jgi:hypothetical protein
MRNGLIFIFAVLVGCGDGDPLGGPHGGNSDPYGPNAADPTGQGNPNPNETTDGGMSSTQSDSGMTMTMKDGGQQQQDSGSQMQQGVTWTQVFNAYLASGTTGNCAHCHSSCNTKSGCYTWLQNKGYISGTTSGLVNPSQSCLSWYGGNMPPSGPKSWANATSDMNAWAQAGAKNN